MADLMIQDFKTEVLELFAETFERVQGLYLDAHTSLFESLSLLSAEQASTPIVADGTSIAAHLEHLRFYLQVLQEHILDQRTEAVDWTVSWQLQQVDEAKWLALQEKVQATYEGITTMIPALEIKDKDSLGGVMAMLVHSAYHLGSIRQLMTVLS
jgi:hypothetical protein